MISICHIAGARLRGRRALTVVLLVLATMAATAPAAWGHAAFVSSRPEPGAQLQTTPGVVEIEFSEPLIADLSSMAVVDPDGRRWDRTDAGQHSMSVSLDTTSLGVYEVEWKTVSPVDGHTLRGSYRFGVGVTPSNVEATATTTPQRADLLLAVARAVEYTGLLTAVGMLLISYLARRAPPLHWVRSRPGWALGVALTAGTVVVVGEALIAAATPTAVAITRYLSAEPGVPRLARLAAVAAALAAVRLGASGVASGAMAVAITALAAGGHAAAGHPAWWAITVDAAHLLAAGLWAGGILALATLRPARGWRGPEARRLLERFSPVAVWAFAATVAFGTLRGAQELTAISDLVTTSYGQVLALKVGAVALMLPLSLRAWRRRAARPRVEGGLAVVAIGAAALLAAYPVPPQRAAEDAPGEFAVAVPSLPQPGDLTLGGATGDVLVGLTLRPGGEGRTDVYVHMLPPAGQDEAAGLAAELTVDRRAVQLEACAATCRRATAVVEDGDVLKVRVAGVDDVPASFTLPDLSAPDGGTLVDKLNTRMERVDSLRYDEVFGPVDPPLRSTAEIVVPDRLTFTILTLDRQTIRIGETMYQREGDGAWEVEQGPPVQVPSYIWDYLGKVAARIIGTDRVDGVRTDVVSFFIDHSSGPIWYRLWVDDEGLVRRAEMRARGHFMDHRYYDFDAPITINPPVPASQTS